MSLLFHPKPGNVLMCDFNTGFKPPEMVKVRPVVVISPRRRSVELCTVVPLSTTAPNPVEAFHWEMAAQSLPGPFATNRTWAKCDMLATVGLGRLDRVRIGKDSNGNRIYTTHQVTAADLEGILKAVMVALGIRIP